MGSARFSLGTTDWVKIGKGLLLAVAGSGLAYVGQASSTILQDIGLPILIPLASVLVNAGLKFLQDTR